MTRSAEDVARIAAIVTELRTVEIEQRVYFARSGSRVGFYLSCPEFVGSGVRFGAPPANEGDEYRGCRCGRPLGEHRPDVIAASGVWSW